MSYSENLDQLQKSANIIKFQFSDSQLLTALRKIFTITLLLLFLWMHIIVIYSKHLITSYIMLHAYIQFKLYKTKYTDFMLLREECLMRKGISIKSKSSQLLSE